MSFTDSGGTCAFSLSNIKNILIPGSVEEIGNSGFATSQYLEDVRICEGVTSIPKEMLYSCSALETVYIPKSIKEIGPSAFSLCRKITDVYYAGSQADWEKITIQDGNDYLTKATLHYNETVPEDTPEDPVVPVYLVGAFGAQADLPYVPDSSVFCAAFGSDNRMISFDTLKADTSGVSFVLPAQTDRVSLVVLDASLAPLNMKKMPRPAA